MADPRRLAANGPPVVALIPPSCCGAGYFRRLRRSLGDRADARAVELPGHGRRRLEPPIIEAALAVRDVAERLSGTGVDAVYGESLGAYVALALTGILGVPLLLVASNSPPSVRPPVAGGGVRSLEDAVAALTATGARIPEEVLTHPELAEQAGAMIVGDLRLSWSMIEATRAAKVGADVHVLTGAADPATIAPAAWAAHTTGRCEVSRIPGGHLLSATNPRGVADWIVRVLSGRQAAAG
ncbi:alpha/beta fold hydrolase [Thermopolyspora sp. NPDC052614]|uniref:thioesterase II family protein n=1 Tax=Thermopolyspora sp. NPDC052614 TaxID=3155682 RepID=UPI0034270786